MLLQVCLCPVMVSLPDSDTQNMAGYDRILTDTFSILPEIKTLNAQESIKKYLRDDFAKAIDRDVEAVDLKGDFFKNPREYVANLRQFANSLLITGKINIDIKKRSIIKDFRDPSGKNSRRFVSIQHWNMAANIALIESETGKVIFEQKFTEKKSDVDPNDALFTFEGMFYSVMEKVIKNFQKAKQIQKRILLKR